MIVLISGLPGSGKSYLAQRLSSRLGFGYLSSDKLRKEVRALGKYQWNDKMRIYERMSEIARQTLKTHRGIIIDGSFSRQAMRDIFSDLAADLSLPISLILVSAPEDLIKARLSKPRPDSEADFNVYKLMRDQFEPVSGPVLKLESTDNNIDQMIEAAVKFINPSHEAIGD